MTTNAWSQIGRSRSVPTLQAGSVPRADLDERGGDRPVDRDPQHVVNADVGDVGRKAAAEEPLLRAAAEPLGGAEHGARAAKIAKVITEDWRDIIQSPCDAGTTTSTHLP